MIDHLSNPAVARVEPSADVAPGVRLGDGTVVWHLAQIRTGAVLGESCVVGRGAYVGSDVVVGAGSKLQNYALVYEPAVLEEGVFIGPAAVLTNDRHPRAITPDGRPKGADDWQPVGVVIRRGAAIGARAVCVAPVTIGAWALVAAGAVVIADVPAHALVGGNPARQLGWVGRSGHRLHADRPGTWRCPATGETYLEVDQELQLTTEKDDARRA